MYSFCISQKPAEASAASSFEWMQRPRHDSFKENENFDGNNNNDKQLEFPETEPVTMGRFLVQSLCDESLSRQARRYIKEREKDKLNKADFGVKIVALSYRTPCHLIG